MENGRVWRPRMESEKVWRPRMEWRGSAGHAQKGNNGSRRPYIRAQSACSWISRSQGVKPSRSLRYQSKQSNDQIIYKGATTSRVAREAAPWEPTRNKIATSRRSGLGYQESPNWDAGRCLLLFVVYIFFFTYLLYIFFYIFVVYIFLHICCIHFLHCSDSLFYSVLGTEGRIVPFWFITY